jgi:two-component system sensor histidine kinase KdpD
MDHVKRTVESDRLRAALLTSISHDLKTPLASVLGAASTMRDLASGLTDAEKRDVLATVIDESDRLRGALLTSISHDLKTPLASVLGAASTLRDLASGLTDTQKDELLATVIDESERLNRFIANLLDMTKLESGAIVPNAAPHDVGEIVGSALRRAGKILVHHNVSLQLGADLPMLELDAVLFEQVLFNLLDNAAKYAPSGTTISVRGVRDGSHVMLQIMDEGSGIPPEELESVFDKFYRAQKGDHVRPGTGLGLAISRGFIEAMHGTISAANRPDRSGAIITIRLPVPAASHALDTAA